MNYAILTVFTAQGATLTFRNVEVRCDNETTLSFRYSAMSDGKTKTGTFFKSRIVGFSVTEG